MVSRPIPASFTAALAELGKDGTTSRFDTELAFLHSYFDDLIEAHRTGEPADLDDLLYVMLGRDSGGEPVLDPQNIRNQIMTFLVAGQLTTSELMPNALYNLMHHPAVHQRVEAEVDAVFGDDNDYLPTYDDIGKFELSAAGDRRDAATVAAGARVRPNGSGGHRHRWQVPHHGRRGRHGAHGGTSSTARLG